jgi:UV DNA damage endonuclease
LEDTDVDVSMLLVNQEDAPEPVDGAAAAEVEAEEHPEAARDGMRRRRRSAM